MKLARSPSNSGSGIRESALPTISHCLDVTSRGSKYLNHELLAQTI